MRHLYRLLISPLIILCFSSLAHSYPDFIGYGYSSCITCHYNGHGGGALTDYGRAVFATDITAPNSFYSGLEDDEIGKRSAFLIKKDLPWWFRPGIKYRGLWFQNNPGSESSKTEKFYNMQADMNLNFFMNKKQKYALITTVSYLESPRQFASSSEKNPPYWFFKEYYLRYQYSKNFWVYLGQLDKVFGIRQVDHTANSRFALGLGQFDQSQGAVLHWAYPTWEISANVFFGNNDESESIKQKGLSISGEYELAEKTKLGASLLNSRSESKQLTRMAGHARLGLSKGASLLAEAGLFENVYFNGSNNNTGIYSIIQGLVNIQRGYNLLSVLQYTKGEMQSTSPERTSWGLGAMMFPWPRTEFRLMALNGKIYDPASGNEDRWQLQGQMHLSW